VRPPEALGRGADAPLEDVRGHALDVLHQFELLLPLLGQVRELDLVRLRLDPNTDAVAVAVQAGDGGEDRLVGVLADLVVVAAEVHAGGEEGLGEGVVEGVAGGAGAEPAEGRPGGLGDAADLVGGGAEVAGDGLPRRPAGAQLGGAGELGVEVGVERRGHDSDRDGRRAGQMPGRIVYIVSLHSAARRSTGNREKVRVCSVPRLRSVSTRSVVAK
jgi:hypothetical protein